MVSTTTLDINDGRPSKPIYVVRAPQEAILDSRLLGQMSAIASAKARDLKHGGGGFDVQEFLGRVSRFLGGRRLDLQEEGGSDEEGYEGGGDLDWGSFAREGLAWSCRAPMTDFMYVCLGCLPFL